MGASESHIKVSGTATGAFFNHHTNSVVVTTKNTLQYFSPAKAIQKTIVIQRKCNIGCIAYVPEDDVIITADDDLRIRIYSVCILLTLPPCTLSWLPYSFFSFSLPFFTSVMLFYFSFLYLFGSLLVGRITNQDILVDNCTFSSLFLWFV
jgi:hypothetical protein